MINKPTPEELERGYSECNCGHGILLHQAGYDVATSMCTQCLKHVADRDEFFNMPMELMSK